MYLTYLALEELKVVQLKGFVGNKVWLLTCLELSFQSIIWQFIRLFMCII